MRKYRAGELDMPLRRHVDLRSTVSAEAVVSAFRHQDVGLRPRNSNLGFLALMSRPQARTARLGRLAIPLVALEDMSRALFLIIAALRGSRRG